MKSEFELYMETGMIGAYQPEIAVLKKLRMAYTRCIGIRCMNCARRA